MSCALTETLAGRLTMSLIVGTLRQPSSSSAIVSDEKTISGLMRTYGSRSPPVVSTTASFTGLPISIAARPTPSFSRIAATISFAKRFSPSSKLVTRLAVFRSTGSP